MSKIAKKLNLENTIYFCKYHDVDTSLHTTIGVKEDEVEKLVQEFKEKGVYEKYRNMSEFEYEKVIKAEKTLKKYKKKKDIEEESPEETKEEPRNKLLDLNDYLFQELETLMSDSLTEDELDRELKISKQVVSVSQTIINNANLLLQAKKHFDTTKDDSSEIAPLLTLDKGKK